MTIRWWHALNGEPLAAGEVAEHLRAPDPQPGRALLPDPRKAALEDAVRVRLFAAEAKRRGLRDNGIARLNRALIDDERRRSGIAPSAVSDDEASRLYADEPGLFNKIPSVDCQASYTPDAAGAEALYAQLADSSGEEFAAAGGQEIGRIDIDSPVDPALLRLSGTLRHAGAVGGPVRLADGRYVILRASSVELNAAPFQGRMIAQVKNWIAHDRERQALDELYGELRQRASVRVFADELARLPAKEP